MPSKFLKPGGIVAYSTCSLNPVEDEAVVAAVLLHYNENPVGKDSTTIHLELMEWPKSNLSGLIHHPGVSNWKIADYHNRNEDSGNHGIDNHGDEDYDDDADGDGDDDDDDDEEMPRLQWHRLYEDAIQARMQGATASMWPPPTSNVKELHLERCFRLWPHDHDSGGFFVALIRRVK